MNNQTECNAIKPINSGAVHRICSGQVVLSLAIAVKELVENAIDASSTSIEVRLRDYGKDLIEVSDNGYGVSQDHFQALTLKHYTSKLQEFTDLESIGTLGFRGEALSSLCALSDLTIITRHKLADYATKLNYDNNGKIVEELPAARNIGTTVSLNNLFASLPVRRKEFIKNLKREYSKMCQLLYAYCLVSKGVKFTCTNQIKESTTTTVVSTEGSHSIRENIISIFGPKQIQTLLTVTMIEAEERILEEYRVKVIPGEQLPFKFECLISDAKHGSGRSSSDRQFFYINSRPCEPNKIMKLVNEIYKQFNSNQSPFVYLNIIIEKSMVDVNITPDKRKIFVENETLLLAVLKTSLLNVFKSCPSTYQVQLIENAINKENSEIKGIKRPIISLQSRGSILSNFQKRSKAAENKTPSKQTFLTENEHFKITNIDESIDESVTLTPNTFEKFHNESLPVTKPETEENEIREENVLKMETEDSSRSILEEISSQDSKKNENTQSQNDKSFSSDNEMYILDDTESSNVPKKVITIRSSMDYLKSALKECTSKKEMTNIKIRFRSEITPASNKNAEQELQRHITKDMFKEMDIIGQFNLGFIVTKLKDDLFIIDQHASDEKYNFEDLQQNTILETQVLVNPKQLELTIGNEELLMEHQKLFEKNGFNFIIDRDAPATKRIKLTAIPMSKNCIFGKDDIEEMLYMLQEDVSLTVCRPSRIRGMFASRACRKSVMIGCPLTHADMRRLVNHMGNIEQPWNCPHGRPTMRHLINLRQIQND